MWLTGQRERIRFLFLFDVYMCVSGRGGIMQCYIPPSCGVLCSVSLEVLCIQQNQHYVRCSSLPTIAQAWHVIIFLLCFDSISITLLPCIAFRSTLLTPHTPLPQHGHLQPIREKESACAANDWDRIKTINHSALQWGFYHRFIWDWLHAACQPTCDGL